ncbi:MAG: hypothetical protein IPM56_03835 [Ignavibacteriales bacterium]|nr:MAG: hypothetical protein IPM56_03835 [Ignavibacteriales bacterium]
MENVSLGIKKILTTRAIVFDVLALAFIYFTPALSHLVNFPIYLLEPMRIMVILSLAHTDKKNVFLIAVTLPIFSFIISSHPSIIKSTLILCELSLNVWLFYYLSRKFKNIFITAFSSILLSKVFYYTSKALLIYFTILTGELVSTPIYIQLVMSLVFSFYLWFALKGSELNG